MEQRKQLQAHIPQQVRPVYLLRTTTACPTQPSSSYTITPNITTKISCTYPTNLTTSYAYTITGSLQIVFTNATIKYLDIDAFTKTAATTYKTTTLSGNISVSNINQSITGSTTAKYTSTTGQQTSQLRIILVIRIILPLPT